MRLSRMAVRCERAVPGDPERARAIEPGMQSRDQVLSGPRARWARFCVSRAQARALAAAVGSVRLSEQPSLDRCCGHPRELAPVPRDGARYQAQPLPAWILRELHAAARRGTP